MRYYYQRNDQMLLNIFLVITALIFVLKRVSKLNSSCDLSSWKRSANETLNRWALLRKANFSFRPIVGAYLLSLKIMMIPFMGLKKSMPLLEGKSSMDDSSFSHVKNDSAAHFQFKIEFCSRLTQKVFLVGSSRTLSKVVLWSASSPYTLTNRLQIPPTL